MILISAFFLLFISFVVHVVWWRIKVPTNTTRVFLFIFTIVLIMGLMLMQLLELINSYSWHDFMRFFLLYAGSALVYIILYSAIEQQSPTLALIDCISQHGEEGSDEESLKKIINPDKEIEARLLVMRNGRWLQSHDNIWRLTPTGKRIAYLFDYAAVLFGLSLGG